MRMQKASSGNGGSFRHLELSRHLSLPISIIAEWMGDAFPESFPYRAFSRANLISYRLLIPTRGVDAKWLAHARNRCEERNRVNDRVCALFRTADAIL